MRVFKVQDGTSWIAKLDESTDAEASARPVGWEAVLFEASVGSVAHRLVYRPRGWLSTATLEDLAAALDEGVAIRARWGQ